VVVGWGWVCVLCVALCASLLSSIGCESVLSRKGLRSVVTNYLVLETACVTLLGPFLPWIIVVHFNQKANILEAIHERRLL